MFANGDVKQPGLQDPNGLKKPQGRFPRQRSNGLKSWESRKTGLGFQKIQNKKILLIIIIIIFVVTLITVIIMMIVIITSLRYSVSQNRSSKARKPCDVAFGGRALGLESIILLGKRATATNIHVRGRIYQRNSTRAVGKHTFSLQSFSWDFPSGNSPEG